MFIGGPVPSVDAIGLSYDQVMPPSMEFVICYYLHHLAGSITEVSRQCDNNKVANPTMLARNVLQYG